MGIIVAIGLLGHYKLSYVISQVLSTPTATTVTRLETPVNSMTSLLPSVQARRGDENLERARSLRDQFRDVIPRDGITSLQNRITMYV